MHSVNLSHLDLWRLCPSLNCVWHKHWSEMLSRTNSYLLFWSTVPPFVSICLPLSHAQPFLKRQARERESYCKGLGELRTSGELFIMNNSIISEVCVAMVMRQSGGGQEGHLHCCRQSAAQEDGAGQSEQASSQIPEHFSTCTSNSVAVMVRIKKMISRKT